MTALLSDLVHVTTILPFLNLLVAPLVLSPFPASFGTSKTLMSAGGRTSSTVSVSVSAVEPEESKFLRACLISLIS